MDFACVIGGGDAACRPASSGRISFCMFALTRTGVDFLGTFAVEGYATGLPPIIRIPILYSWAERIFAIWGEPPADADDEAGTGRLRTSQSGRRVY